MFLVCSDHIRMVVILIYLRMFYKPLVMNLACVTLGMSMPEALAAATINSAASLKKSHTHGSIQAGNLADLVILNAPR